MTTEAGAIQAAGGPPTYAPSWVTVVNRWFEGLPGPTWLAYVAAMALGAGASAGAALVDPTTSLAPFALVYYGALPFAVLALIQGLDRTAGRALRALRPLLRMDDAVVAETHERLTVVPARPATLITIVSIAITPLSYIMDPVGAGVAGYTPAALLFRWAWEGFVTSVFLVLIYHTIRQLRLIGRLHEAIGRVDVFDQGPLYALSWVTSRTSVGLIVLLVPSIFLIPQGADVSYILLSVAWYGLALVIAAAAFFLPLRGVHDRISAEKQRLESEVGRRLSSTLSGIHAAVDAGDGRAVEAGNRVLVALLAERDLVKAIPTWPWSAGALTGFVSAVLLPLALFLVQQALARFV